MPVYIPQSLTRLSGEQNRDESTYMVKYYGFGDSDNKPSVKRCDKSHNFLECF